LGEQHQSFDAACGFGGYRESGFGREGGREGLLEYLEPAWFKKAPALKSESISANGNTPDVVVPTTAIDRTVKLYIGGKQTRPDSGYSIPVHGAKGELLGAASLGNRKDIRNPVEAARKAEGWGKTTAHNRAQILFYIAENLPSADEIKARLTAAGGPQGAAEVQSSLERLFSYAAGPINLMALSIVRRPKYFHRHERTHRHRRSHLPERRAAARIFLAGAAADFRWKYGSRSSVRKIPSDRGGFVPGI
jgi:acyl-CoA reductase-like NAD-dependent aldehyde dehydrogenase